MPLYPSNFRNVPISLKASGMSPVSLNAFAVSPCPSNFGNVPVCLKTSGMSPCPSKPWNVPVSPCPSSLRNVPRVPDPCLELGTVPTEPVQVGSGLFPDPAASEPNLKVRCKPRKCLDRRKNPLTRKESAPPSLKRRPPEAIGEGSAWTGVWVWGDRGKLGLPLEWRIIIIVIVLFPHSVSVPSPCVHPLILCPSPHLVSVPSPHVHPLTPCLSPDPVSVPSPMSIP